MRKIFFFVILTAICLQMAGCGHVQKDDIRNLISNIGKIAVEKLIEEYGQPTFQPRGFPNGVVAYEYPDFVAVADNDIIVGIFEKPKMSARSGQSIFDIFGGNQNQPTNNDVPCVPGVFGGCEESTSSSPDSPDGANETGKTESTTAETDPANTEQEIKQNEDMQKIVKLIMSGDKEFLNQLVNQFAADGITINVRVPRNLNLNLKGCE